MLVLCVSKQFGVPEYTHRDRVLGKVQPETVTMGENLFYSSRRGCYCRSHYIMANYGYCYTRHELADTASDYAFQLAKRNNKIP